MVGTNPVVFSPKAPDASLGEAHRWADWIELTCLVSIDRVVSFEEMTKLLKADHTAAADFANQLAGTEDSESEVDEDVGDDLAQDDDDLVHRLISHPRPTDGASRTDKRQVLAGDLVRLLKRRELTHSSNYPFVITGSGDAVELSAIGTLSAGQRTYVFLLLCSALAAVDRTTSTSLTTAFELVSAVALENMVPSAAVSGFGTATAASSGYRGSLSKKIHDLASDLGETPGPRVKNLPSANTGDFGLDVVAVHDHGDQLPGRLSIFLQAACTDEWKLKQNTCKADAWARTLSLLSPQVPVCAIPFSFRDASGDWHDEGEISQVLLLDRARLLHHLEPHLSGDPATELILARLLPNHVLDFVLAMEVLTA